MCGICGWICFDSGVLLDNKGLQERQSAVESMNKALFHRGPDDQMLWACQSDRCVFGHSRLIIVDPLGGKQPMQKTKEGINYCITYNGELYNTEEIRGELTSHGYGFSSYSDTEVVLTAFMEWGTSCLQKFEGNFAFAIWHNDQLFIARDRLGVKPFFYSDKLEGNLLFASEIKALLTIPSVVSSDVTFHNLMKMLASSSTRPTGFVPFVDITELEPGYAGTFSQKGLTLWQYWDLPKIGFTSIDTFEDAKNRVHSLLETAIKRQLVSDVPFGCLLSGGLDSSSIVHFAHKEIQEVGKDPMLQTFSLRLPCYKEHFKSSETKRSGVDEDYIPLMLSKYNLDHSWVEISSQELLNAVEECTTAKDYPISGDMDLSLFIMFKKIKSKASMVLSGEGADELFGGYRHFYNDSIQSAIPQSSATAFQLLLKDEISETVNLKKEGVKLYSKVVEKCGDIVDANEVENDEERQYRRRIYLAMKTFLCGLLERKDRLSMSSSIEVRVPFTDHDLVEYVFNLPKRYKWKNGMEKFILRKCLETEPKFPEEIRKRTKSPYPSTVDPQTVQLSLDLIKTLLDRRDDPPLFNWLDKTKVQQEFSAGCPNLKKMLHNPIVFFALNIYSFNFWMEEYKVNVVT